MMAVARNLHSLSKKPQRTGSQDRFGATRIGGCAMISCLVVNDAVKVAMIKWRFPTAVG
jgi:hypothetical protein